MATLRYILEHMHMKNSVTVYLLQIVFEFLCIFILCGKAFKCQHKVVIGEIIFLHLEFTIIVILEHSG